MKSSNAIYYGLLNKLWLNASCEFRHSFALYQYLIFFSGTNLICRRWFRRTASAMYLSLSGHWKCNWSYCLLLGMMGANQKLLVGIRMLPRGRGKYSAERKMTTSRSPFQGQPSGLHKIQSPNAVK